MQQLTEQQVRTWIDSIFGLEGGDDDGRYVSTTARYTTCALADVPYVPTYSSMSALCEQRELRQFRSFLDGVVRVMDEHGVKPWVDPADKQVGYDPTGTLAEMPDGMSP